MQRPYSRCSATVYLQQLGHLPQQVAPQQLVLQQLEQQEGHDLQHDVPQHEAALGAACEAPENAAAAKIAAKIVFNMSVCLSI